MRALILSLLTLMVTTMAFADGGRIEINQVSVEAAGGFPFRISSPGNYVLTSDLAVPADTQAILLIASDVVLDLGGFRIAGPHACSVAGCTAGVVNGISGQEGSGRRVTVRNGSIRGFSGTCVQLLGESYVTELFVSRCGQIGIEASLGSLVRANRVSDTGRQGIRLVGRETGAAENVVLLTGLGVGRTGPEAAGIDGGSGLGGNVCAQAGCSPRGKRRFYMSSNVSQAGNASKACMPGFHVGYFAEIMSLSDLYYEAFLGRSVASTMGTLAWLVTLPSRSCDNFTNTSASIATAAKLDLDTSGVPAWQVIESTCSNVGRPVWCVED